MRIVPLTTDRYTEWDNFCIESRDAWFWHTTKWLDYSLAYKPALNAVSHSFLVYDKDRLVAVCPIIVQNVSVDDTATRVIAYPGGHGMMPVIALGLKLQERRNIRRVCLEQTDSIAKDNQVKQATLWMSPLSESCRNLTEISEQLDSMRRGGYVETSWLTLLIDLSQDRQEIRRQMRKGHRYDTKRGENLFRAEILYGPSADSSLFETYTKLHELAAGRKTRPQQTFDMMYDWVKKGNALLVLAQHDGTYRGASLVILEKDGGYYASSCVHPAYINEPVGHAMQWAVICWMREKGYRWYELGHIRYGTLPQDPASEKEVQISHYERGFGGMPVMFSVAEKYYSQEYYLRISQERVAKYVSALGNERE